MCYLPPLRWSTMVLPPGFGITHRDLICLLGTRCHSKPRKSLCCMGTATQHSFTVDKPSLGASTMAPGCWLLKLGNCVRQLAVKLGHYCKLNHSSLWLNKLLSAKIINSPNVPLLNYFYYSLLLAVIYLLNHNGHIPHNGVMLGISSQFCFQWYHVGEVFTPWELANIIIRCLDLAFFIFIFFWRAGY